MTSEARQQFLRVAETLGFALNISALRAIYEHRLEQTGLAPETVEQSMKERGQFWRLRMFAGSVAIGTLGYLLREHTGIGSLLMYGSLLVIAIHANSSWLAKPGLSAKYLFNGNKRDSANG